MAKVDNINVDKEKTILSIWDGGCLRYERFSTGIERSWKVLEREATLTGFIETLLELPLYITPTEIIWKENIPAFLQKNGIIEIPGWTIQEI